MKGSDEKTTRPDNPSADRILPDDATLAQIRAADPGESTWVSANAGSGKTRVLTDRVARLLLREVPPQKILCLTYTKAAAAHMQNKLFERLGEWAMLDDGALADNLVALGEAGERMTPEFLRNARTLFARALETPGGLKIQTIHSFCASLLRRFPLEAGVTPGFREMDERSARRLRERVLEEIADGPLRPRWDALARHLLGRDVDALLAELVAKRDHFSNPASRAGIWARFGLPDGYDENSWLGEVWDDDVAEIVGQLRQVLKGGKPSDLSVARQLDAIDLSRPAHDSAVTLEGLFVYGPKTSKPGTPKVDRLPTRALRDAHPVLMARLHPLMQRFADARPRRLGLLAARKALALHEFAEVFLARFEHLKQAQGWLDFDDLILKARDLLSRSSMAQWVLYRLDGGIDHILVDEAQDTSPEQWQVISLLEREFTTGRSAREVVRTIFVVGDEKQSIYSFQGADPAAFERMRKLFEERLNNVQRALNRRELLFSFRSSSAILRVVDAALKGGQATGVTTRQVTHRAFHHGLPGRVDLWPFVEKPEESAPQPWDEPLDMPASDDPSLMLAARIADAIKGMLDSGTVLPTTDGPRRLGPGDFLILVQRRSDLFHEIIKALKDRGLPVAGADRLKIGAVLAVKDLIALLSFLVTPEDDLSLACALRSPLFRLGEADLFRLAHGRRGTLWQRLREHKDAFPEAYAMLDDLLGRVDFLRPFEMIERILTHHGGREYLVARLGAEASDGIDALLDQAMQYERTEPPGMTGFLGWVSTDDSDLKRQLDTRSDEIRVMTVHGAKGLESPVVILPDTAQRKDGDRSGIAILDDGFAAWKLPEAEAPPEMVTALRQARAFRQQERMRLFYVALTRAENWLIICGAGNRGKNADSWYDLADEAVRAAGAHKTVFQGMEILRHEHAPAAPGSAGADPWTQDATAGAGEGMAAAGQGEPDDAPWMRTPAPVAQRGPKILVPSDLGGDKVVAGATEGLDEGAALRRGRQIHLLLEHLPDCPPGERRARATVLLAHGPDAATPDEIDTLLAEVTAVLDRPEHQFLFAPGTMAEVPLAARLGDAPLLGVIDRLVVQPQRVLAVDYKTNAVLPETAESVPEGILRQMGAYAAALGQIYPDREIETAILWTGSARLMMLPRQVVAGALGRAGAP